MIFQVIVCFYVSDVELGLSKFSGIKSVGPDRVSSEFLYIICLSLLYTLWLISRKSSDDGIHPDLFKHGGFSSLRKTKLYYSFVCRKRYNKLSEFFRFN